MRSVRPVGWRGLLVECDDLEDVMAVHRALVASRPTGVVDLVPAARTVLLTFDGSTNHEQVAAAVARCEPGANAGVGQGEDSAETPANDLRQGALVTLDITYDGADLAEVATLTQLSVDEVVRRHVGATYVVAFTGFAPGFAYLAGGDSSLVVPRRATPRTRVPAGSVAMAGEFTGIYPRVGPGGWQLLGHTSATLWDARRDPPALLTPGTRVRFTEAGS